MTPGITTLLVIEDNPGDAHLLRTMLRDDETQDTHLIHVECMTDAEQHLALEKVDIIVLDLGLPDAQGLDAVRRAHAAAPRVPLVVVTGTDDETLASLALQEGAQDYLVKGQIEPRSLHRALRYAVERKAMDDALFAEKERAEVTLRSIGDAVACTDLQARVTFLNQAAEMMTGWTSDEALGRPLSEVFLVVDAETGAPVADATDHLPTMCVVSQRHGIEIPIETSVAAIRDRQGLPMGAVIVARDVTSARAAALAAVHSAQHDYLTGLPNRVLLNDRIGQAIALASRRNAQVAVLFLDLDGFKHINDSLGHSAGDRLLRSVAERLAGVVRGSDTVSRQGGDEFVVLLSDIRRPEDAAMTARRMLAAIAEVHAVDDSDLHITTSIGVSIFPDDGPDAETLIKNADTAMYQAKDRGRDDYQFFRPEMNARAVERHLIEEHLRSALERDEFSLNYQPKVDVATGRITGAEALLRWNHPTRGAVEPGTFIPVAEESGLILPIGRWVLREACRQAKAWLTQGLPPLTVAVNVSAMEFQHEGFVQGVFRTLADAGLDASSLELELTESVLMKRVEETGLVLQMLRERGVRIAIDDFGTGYSSLSYLSRFPVDALKIDQSFVRQISSPGATTTIVTAVITIARSLKLRLVAEGVESAEELAFLRAHLCDEAQGFYLGRPMTAVAFAAVVAASAVAATDPELSAPAGPRIVNPGDRPTVSMAR